MTWLIAVPFGLLMGLVLLLKIYERAVEEDVRRRCELDRFEGRHQ